MRKKFSEENWGNNLTRQLPPSASHRGVTPRTHVANPTPNGRGELRDVRAGTGKKLGSPDTDPGGAGSVRLAHQFTISGSRRIFVRGHANVRKRLLIHVSGFNLGLLMRRLTGIGTPRSLQGCVLARLFSVFGAKMGRWLGWNRLWERLWAPIGPDSLFRVPRTHQ